MRINLLANIAFLVSAVTILPQCIRSSQSTVAVNQDQGCARHPKMEALRDMMTMNFLGTHVVKKEGANWEVTLKHSTDPSTKGRLSLEIKNLKDKSQGAVIYINFAKIRREFDMMVEWNDQREDYMFHSTSDEAKMEERINSPEFLDTVRLIIVAAHVSHYEKLGLVAGYLLTWYPEDRYRTLFGETSQKALVIKGAVTEIYQGTNLKGNPCNVNITKDEDGNIYSVFIDNKVTTSPRIRLLMFNIIPLRQKTYENLCMAETMATNTHAVVDGKRKAQWTFAKTSGGMPSIFRTSFESIPESDGKETLRVWQQSSSYMSTVIGVATAQVKNTEIKLCLDRDGLKKATAVTKATNFINASIIVPIPFLGSTDAVKVSGECSNLQLTGSVPVLQQVP